MQKIVSGGQTGVDRAALDAAIELGIPHGGWCPQGRKAEDGSIPEQYQLSEATSADYAFRTEQNVIDSDGTLILYFGSMTGGTRLTWKMTKKHDRPCLTVDLRLEDFDAMIDGTRGWIRHCGIGVLNVAGPRETSIPGIGVMAREFLTLVLDEEVDQ